MADDTNTPLFGTPSVSKEALEHRRQLALQLIKQGSDTSPVISKWQGAARAMQNIMGNIQLGMEERSESEARKKQHDTLRDLAEKAGYPKEQADLIAATASANFIPQTDILHKLAETGMPRYGTVSTQNATVPTALPAPNSAGVGAPPPPAPRPSSGGSGMPGGGPSTDMTVTPKPGVSSGITPRAEADLRRAGELSREQHTAQIFREANENAMNDDLDRMKAAPKERQQLRLMRDTIDKTDFTRGDAGPIVNRIKQGVNGLFGVNITGDTSGPEFLGKLQGVLSREIANKGRGGTDFSLSSAQSELPGSLQGSKEGSLKLVDHLIQMRTQDEKLGNALYDKMRTDPDNYISHRNRWLGDPKNALTSPLTGKNTAETPLGSPPRYIWSREKGLQPQ